ncbi:DUF169 domain-containing protein [Methanolobus sp. ZRKC3]|uniref:DUF169 domain-containing protein n=1 Tax=Methanolobus sp. ZRKC3 TaxID=3125786 RepID=UPI00324A6433
MLNTPGGVKLADIPKIKALMDSGEPVCITFGNECGQDSELLYCEIVQKASQGETFLIGKQRCSAGDYVLGVSEQSPADYYLRSGRYADRSVAERAASSLPRVEKEYRSIRIEPLSQNTGNYDILLLYLKAEAVMRIIQAYAFHFGEGLKVSTIGAASVCGDCTALPLKSGIGLSYGCKGSRKHSYYSNVEMPFGISHDLVEKIEKGVESTPNTFD